MSNEDMNIEAEIHTLLKKIGPGRMSSTTYDTAWIARLGEIDWELSNQALGWVCENQLSDGSWGAKNVFYYHDRVICTLAAMIALTHRGRRAYDKTRTEKGLVALERITIGATQGLAADPNGATVGFEMIAPTLVAEAEQLGLIKQQGERILGRLARLRSAKVEKLAGRKINRFMTPSFSSEMAGVDGQAILDVDNLQEENGSIGLSPSATAYFAKHLKPGDPSAMAYLRKWISNEGGLPDLAPFDIFEPAWVLWNLRLGMDLAPETISLCLPHLNRLQRFWDDKEGIGHSSESVLKDSDDSGLVFELLTFFGRNIDIQGVLGYEDADHFRCYALEAHPSISVNAHVLGALRAAGFESKHPSVQKVLNFLRVSQINASSWGDKWHISPYYATSHVIILAHLYDFELCQKAIDWLISTQLPNGAWGISGPTAEETAYAIQALCIWKRAGGKIPKETINLGVEWLLNNTEPPYPPLWIGKALYCPELIVRSAILSAIQLGKQIL